MCVTGNLAHSKPRIQHHKTDTYTPCISKFGILLALPKMLLETLILKITLYKSYLPTLRHILLVATLAITTVATAGTWIEDADKSILEVVIKTPDGIGAGTGYVVANNGIVATNHHVIDGALKIKAFQSNTAGKERKGYAAEVIWSSETDDLAILRVPELDLPPLPLTVWTPGKGSSVIAIGFPGAADNAINQDGKTLESTVTKGIVGRVLKTGWDGNGDFEIIQHSAQVNSGNSGGPLFDACGRVIGTNTGKALGRIEGNRIEGFHVNQSDGLYFASHAKLLRQALLSLKIDVAFDANGCSESEIVPGNTYPVPQAITEQNPLMWIGIAFAIILGVAAFIFAIRNPAYIKETYTQLRRKKDNISPAVMPSKPVASLSLTGTSGNGNTIHFNIPCHMANQPDGVTIGRDPAYADFVIADTSVSRQHCKIYFTNNGWHITDTNSTNGTKVNGKLLRGDGAHIMNGSLVEIGKVKLEAKK